MQDTRAESSRRIAELEEQVAALKSIDGEAARMREKAAHQSMAERCAKVSQNLRVVEGQLERTQALLNPTKVQLLRLQKEHLELKSSYSELKK
jgi:archaellum component FlaC